MQKQPIIKLYRTISKSSIGTKNLEPSPQASFRRCVGLDGLIPLCIIGRRPGPPGGIKSVSQPGMNEATSFYLSPKKIEINIGSPRNEGLILFFNVVARSEIGWKTLLPTPFYLPFFQTSLSLFILSLRLKIAILFAFLKERQSKKGAWLERRGEGGFFFDYIYF